MRWFKNMKIASKLIVSFVVVALIAGIVGGIGIYNIYNLGENDKLLYQRMTVPLDQLLTYVDAYQQVNGLATELAADSSLVNDTNTTKLENYEEKSLTELSEVSTTILTAEGQKLITNLTNNTKSYYEVVGNVVSLSRSGKTGEAVKLMQSDASKLSDDIESGYASLKELKASLAEKNYQNNMEIRNSAIFMMIGFIIVGMFLAVLLGIVISKIISVPIKTILDAANKVANRDLNIDIDIDSKDETGSLATAFQIMCDNISEALENINMATEQVAAGSTQVSDSSISLSQGVTEQASALEELTASLEEIAKQTSLNAQGADQAKSNTEAAQKNAEEGNRQMGNMLHSMEEINESSSNISKIIKVIDDIAFQTNILALNAAVEAARAGQHGKGFAVVADEVRNLAARSASAAKETTGMIEHSIKKVEEGRKIANETAEALNQIVRDIAKATDLVGTIATASNEQAIGVEQINQGIMQIADVVQTTSATAEETASASEELSSQAVMLKEQVSTFHLKSSSGRMTEDYSDLSPEVRKMLDKMGQKKFQGYEKPVKARSNKIRLSDQEFEKY